MKQVFVEAHKANYQTEQNSVITPHRDKTPARVFPQPYADAVIERDEVANQVQQRQTILSACGVVCSSSHAFKHASSRKLWRDAARGDKRQIERRRLAGEPLHSAQRVELISVPLVNGCVSH